MNPTTVERTITRSGVVTAVAGGCATIEVGVPCGGCSRTGCGTRREAGRVTVPGCDSAPGEAVRLSVSAGCLSRVCMALFAPTLAWLAFSGALISSPAGDALTGRLGVPGMVALCVVGTVTSLLAGRLIGRRAMQRLELVVSPRVGSGI